MTTFKRLTGINRFAPTDIAGLVLWYDFSDGGSNGSLYTDTARTTHVTTDGQTIKGIADKSVSVVHGSEATNPPVYKTAIQNSKSVGRYVAASSQKLALGTNVAALNALVGSLSVIVAVQTNNTASYRVIVAYSEYANASNPFEFRFDNVGATPKTQFEHSFDVPNTDTLTATNATDNLWHVQAAIRTVGSTVALFTDGTANGTPSAPTTPGTSAAAAGNIGAIRHAGSDTFFFDGDMGEIIVYNSALSGTNRARVEAYLKAKWGTP